MKLTKDRRFADSNVLLYLLGADDVKKGIASEILASRPMISTQVLSENINVLLKKFRQLSTLQITEHARILQASCTVAPVNVEVVNLSLQIHTKYRYHWFDCTILSAALLNNCNVLFSEDMQHEQIIEGKLKIVNPFVG